MSDLGRLTNVLRAIVRKLTAHTVYHALYEYSIVAQPGENQIDLQPTDPALGLPPLSAVPMRPGVGGARVYMNVGARVLLAFVNGDPSRPAVISYDTAFGDGLDPIEVDLVKDSETDSFEIAFPARRVLRYGDSILNPLGGALVIAPAPTPTPVSKVKA